MSPSYLSDSNYGYDVVVAVVPQMLSESIKQWFITHASDSYTQVYLDTPDENLLLLILSRSKKTWRLIHLQFLMGLILQVPT